MQSLQIRQRSAEQWFREAARCYIEKHQGCAWCGGAHRVLHRRRQQRHSYSCNACDFHVGLDEAAGEYFIISGEDITAGALTMYE